LSRLTQSEVPALQAGERVLLTGHERTAGLFSKRGRVTLTNQRLVFQRPRLFFVPPWRPDAPVEFPLSAVVGIEAESVPNCAMLFRLRAQFPKLSISLRDGSKWECGSLMARSWRRYILRARRQAA
jgi:hypothetical protein